MKPLERDELLVRLDEKSNNIYHLVEKQERHLAELNNKVAKNVLNIDRNSNRIASLENLITSGVSLKLNKRQVTIGSAGVIAIITTIVAVLDKVIK